MLKYLASLFFHGNKGNAVDTITKGVLDGVVQFLLTMMPERSARKVVAIILLLFRLPVKAVVDYSGFKKSSIYMLRKELRQLTSGSDFLKFVTRQCVVRKGRGPGCDFIGSVYGKKRRFARTYSGCKRYNALGALDYMSKKVITVTNSTYPLNTTCPFPIGWRSFRIRRRAVTP